MARTKYTVRSPQALGDAVARLRYQAGLTQAELADRLGINRRYVIEVESGKPNLFSLRLFELLRELDAHIQIIGPERADSDA